MLHVKRKMEAHDIFAAAAFCAKKVMMTTTLTRVLPAHSAVR
jgi:hypothetical protein